MIEISQRRTSQDVSNNFVSSAAPFSVPFGPCTMGHATDEWGHSAVLQGPSVLPGTVQESTLPPHPYSVHANIDTMLLRDNLLASD